MRILFVDDNADLRALIPLLLEKRGYRVRSAESAAEALHCVTEFCPNVVISDISMPEMDGYDLIAQLRASSEKPFVAVALTGFDEPSRDDEARQGVFDQYLTKPINFEKLYRTLDGFKSDLEAARGTNFSGAPAFDNA